MFCATPFWSKRLSVISFSVAIVYSATHAAFIIFKLRSSTHPDTFSSSVTGKLCCVPKNSTKLAVAVTVSACTVARARTVTVHVPVELREKARPPNGEGLLYVCFVLIVYKAVRPADVRAVTALKVLREIGEHELYAVILCVEPPAPFPNCPRSALSG